MSGQTDITPTQMPRWLVATALFAAAVGAVFRLSGLSLIEFRHDSAFWTLEVTRVLAGGYWPLLGQQVGSVSVPLANGPFMTYATSVVFALAGASPVAMATVIALSSVAAIGATYLLGRRLYSPVIGLVAAILLAVAPWAVLYGRMLWPQSFLPLLIPINVLLLLHHIERRSMLSLLLSGILLGVCVQLHLSALALAAITAGLAIVYSRRRGVLWMLLVGLIVGYAPVLLYDVANGFPHLRALTQLSSLHAREFTLISHLSKLMWNFSNVMSGQGMWVSKVGNEAYLPALVDWSQGVLFSVAFLIAVLAIVLSWRGRGSILSIIRRVQYQDVIVMAFTLAPLAYFAISRSHIQRHYFIVLLPVPFILLARGWSLVAASLRGRVSTRLVRSLAAAALFLICALNVVTLSYAAVYVTATGGRSDYGTVWEDKDRIARWVAADAPQAVEIDLSRAQEPLPYLYLFRQLRPDLHIDPDAIYETRVQGLAPADWRYELVELEYHSLRDAESSYVVARARGIAVVKTRLTAP